MNAIEFAVYNLQVVTDQIWPFSPNVGRKLEEDCRRYMAGDHSVQADISNLTRLSRHPTAQQFQEALKRLTAVPLPPRSESEQVSTITPDLWD